MHIIRMISRAIFFMLKKMQPYTVIVWWNYDLIINVSILIHYQISCTVLLLCQSCGNWLHPFLTLYIRVHNMLQERSQYAQAVSDVYMIATEMIRIFSQDGHPFQVNTSTYNQKCQIHHSHTSFSNLALRHSSEWVLRRSYDQVHGQ